MQDRELKEAVETITMPEEMKTRILRRCAEETERTAPAVPARRHPKPLRFAAAAAVAAVLTVTAGAVGVHFFRNPTIVDRHEDLPGYAGPAIEGVDLSEQDESAVSIVIADGQDASGNPLTYGEEVSALGGVTIPLDQPAATLSQMRESRVMTTENWQDPTAQRHDWGLLWNEPEVLRGDGPLWERRFHGEEGGTLTEYLAPAAQELAAVLPRELTVNLDALCKSYSAADHTAFLQTIREADGTEGYRGLNILFEGPRSGSWLTLNYGGSPDFHYADNDFVTREDYDEAYTYTTAQGLEFLITAYGDMVWAECGLEHSHLSVTAGFISTAEMEDFLDCGAMTLREIGTK